MCHGQILSDAVRRARKEHRCTVCDQPIAIGRKYRRAALIFEGGLHISKDHMRCAAKLSSMDQDDVCYSEPNEIARDTARDVGWREYLKTLRAEVGRWLASK